MADQDVLELDALEPPFNVDPYSTFARLRQEPVRRVRMLGLPAWLVTRYEDVRQALADPRLSNDVRNASPAAIAAAPWLDAREAFGIGRNMMQTDPPDHTRLRRLVGAAFTPGRIEALRPRIQQIADELVDEFLPRGRADLVEEFAIPLPTTVIMELLGVPAQDRQDFKRWNDLAAAEPDDPAEAIAAYRSIVSYLAELIARKERELAAGTGADDLLTALIAARDEGGRCWSRRSRSSSATTAPSTRRSAVLRPPRWRSAAWSSRAAASPCCWRPRRPTETRPGTRTRTPWTSTATPSGTSASATASTSAWVRRWPGWSPGSRSGPCSTAAPTSRSPCRSRSCSGGAAPTSAA